MTSKIADGACNIRSLKKYVMSTTIEHEGMDLNLATNINCIYDEPCILSIRNLVVVGSDCYYVSLLRYMFCICSMRTTICPSITK